MSILSTKIIAECCSASPARRARDSAFRRRKRNERAANYLFAALFAKTRQIPNVAENRVCCPVHPESHTALFLPAHYLARGQAVLYCVDGCSEAEVYAALGIDPADLIDNRRIPASNPAARRRIEARRLAEAS